MANDKDPGDVAGISEAIGKLAAERRAKGLPMMTTMTMIEALVKDIYVTMADDAKFKRYIDTVWHKYSLVWRIAKDNGWYK